MIIELCSVCHVSEPAAALRGWFSCSGSHNWGRCPQPTYQIPEFVPGIKGRTREIFIGRAHVKSALRRKSSRSLCSDATLLLLIMVARRKVIHPGSAQLPRRRSDLADLGNCVGTSFLCQYCKPGTHRVASFRTLLIRRYSTGEPPERLQLARCAAAALGFLHMWPRPRWRHISDPLSENVSSKNYKNLFRKGLLRNPSLSSAIRNLKKGKLGKIWLYLVALHPSDSRFSPSLSIPWQNVRVKELDEHKQGKLLNFPSHKPNKPLTWVVKLGMSITVTEFPQLAHIESSKTSSALTGSEPRQTRVGEAASQRESAEGGKRSEPQKVTWWSVVGTSRNILSYFCSFWAVRTCERCLRA